MKETVGLTRESGSPGSAEAFLFNATCTIGERGLTYDSSDKERSMSRTVEAFHAITGIALSPSEGWLLLQLLKDVRQWSSPGYHEDSAIDCVAYAALKAEALKEEG